MPAKQTILRGVRHLLKYTLNPLTRGLARTSYGPFAIIRHVGRRSGKQYETPLIVAPTVDGIVIELTYGPEADWYKNMLAAGGCAVILHGKTYVIDKIELIDAETGRAAFPLPARLILRAVGLKYFVKLGVQDADERERRES
jgi:deazaflavin-dependent oxidoreductase (nitroreductase family)